MKRLGQLLCFIFNLAIASAAFALVLVSMLWLFDGASREAFAEHILAPAFWMAFALGWAPSLLAYASIDHASNRVSTASACISYAKWGGFSAASLPTFIFAVMFILDGFQGRFSSAGLSVMLLFLVWFFIPGAIAGAVFGALVPIGLPSSRDATRSAR